MIHHIACGDFHDDAQRLRWTKPQRRTIFRLLLHQFGQIVRGMDRLATFCCFFAITQCFGQGTLNITFDGPPLQPRGTAYSVAQYYESNMWFLPLTSFRFGRNGGAIPGYPDDGSAYLQAALNESLMFGFSDGSLFAVTSVDLAGYSDVVPDFTVNFVG